MELIKLVWVLGSLVQSLSLTLPFSTVQNDPLNVTFDDVVKEIFQIADDNSTVIFPKDTRSRKFVSQELNFTVRSNTEGKLSVNDVFNNSKSTIISKKNTTLLEDNSQISEKDKYKPICKQEEHFFCSKVENYPSEKIKSILDNFVGTNLETFFGDDVISEPNYNITQRFDIGEETLCTSKEEIIYPQGLYGVDGKLEYIVNDPQHKQAIRIEQCMYKSNNDRRCKMTESFPNGYVTECKQKYMRRYLLTYDPYGNIIQKKVFDIPSCCQCVVKNEY